MKLPERVGVYGGGRMGAGIAQAFLVSGTEVTVIETARETADAATGRVASSVKKAGEKGKLTAPVADVLGRLTVSTDKQDLAGCGLVVEAVPEDLDLKAQVFGEVSSVAPQAWLATNTSSLSIDAIAARAGLSEQFIGLHFFNPVPASDLVEIVRGTQTSTELVDLARQWVEALGKTAIVVKDSPGFASSRLGVALALEAMRMLEEGVATAAEIDTAMTLGYRHPMGPLRTTDIVGLDVRMAIAEHLAREVDSSFTPPAILRDKVASGHLGRKSGCGFYEW